MLMAGPLDSGIPYYPVNDFGPLMKGMVIGGIGIVHVFLAQFAIGGGMLLCYFERLPPRGRGPDARAVLRRYFPALLLGRLPPRPPARPALWVHAVPGRARP